MQCEGKITEREREECSVRVKLQRESHYRQPGRGALRSDLLQASKRENRSLL